jgi:hypothetical protein
VQVYTHSTGSSSATVERALSNRDLWGAALFGHGYVKWTSWWNPLIDHNYDSINGGLDWGYDGQNIINRAILAQLFHQRVGLLIAYLCDADIQNYQTLVSPNGHYYGATGYISAIGGPSAVGYWGSWAGLVNNAAN